MRIIFPIVVWLTIVAAVPIAAQTGESTFSYALAYDAATDTGPCPISKQDYDAILNKKPPEQVLAGDSCDRRRFVFRDATGVPLLVIHPRFRAQYTATAVSQINRGSGVIEVRGLADIAPLSLASLGTPVAHGGRQPSAVAIPALTPAQVLAQLADPTQMHQPLLTIDAQWRELQDARVTLERDRQELLDAIDRLQPTAADCARLSGAPTLRTLSACVMNIEARILQNNNTPGAWMRTTFEDLISQIDQRIADLHVIRDRVAAYGFRGVADRVETESEQLVAKLKAFQQNVDTVLAAISTVARRSEPPFELDGAVAKALPPLRRAEIRRRLKERYGQTLDDAELNQLTRDEALAANADALDRKLRDAVDVLVHRATARRDEAAASVDDLRGEENHVRLTVDTLTLRVDELNRTFARMFEAINTVYLRVPAEPFTRRDVDLSANAGTNREVIGELKSDEKFKPYRFSAGPSSPAAGGSGPLLGAAPNAPINASPANLPQNVDKFFALELHKVWNANIVAGFVLSSIPRAEYGVRAVSTVQNGAPATLLVSTLTNDQQPTAHYLVGFNYYFGGRDSYPGVTKNRWMPGALIGIGLENTRQFFLGANFEPALGIDLSVGVHYGEQTALQLGYMVDQTALPSGSTTAPTRTIMKTGVFGMIGFDLNIFRRFMGSVAPPH